LGQLVPHRKAEKMQELFSARVGTLTTRSTTHAGDEAFATMRKQLSRVVARACGSSIDMGPLSKKSLRAAEQDRADVARARRRWIRQQRWLNSTRLVFLDETAVNTKMVRLSGRCPRRRATGRLRSAGTLEDAHLRGEAAVQWDDGAPRGRWGHKRADFLGVRRAMPGSQTQRHCHHGQLSGP
jgi:hypothetical protein